MNPTHKNETGSFQELAKADEVQFGQLSILTIQPKCTRGNHYHMIKEEWFCCIHGSCELEIKNIKDGSEKKMILDEEHREFVKVNPYENHIINNISDSHICELLIIVSKPYDEKKPDTYSQK